MKTKIYSIDGNKGKEISLPSAFQKVVREELIQRIIEAKKTKQPYSPKPGAGMEYSASGKLKHHRKVWKSQYGRGMSRVPRKIMTRRGSQFNWVGADVPNTRGGRRAHPPKIASMLVKKRINKKELKIALESALSATTLSKWIFKRYSSLEDEKVVNAPYVVESKFIDLKSKELISSLKKILGDELFKISVRKKEIRSGRGKLRGRKYKRNLGLLIVVGNDEKLKTNSFEVVSANRVGVNNLAVGGPGRLTVYTENAIKDLGEKFEGNKK